MVHDLVKAKRSDIFADIRPAHWPVVRIRLEVTLVRVRKLRKRSGVMESRDSVPNDERLLELRLERARYDAICNIVTWNHIETRIRIHTRYPQVARAKQRDECCVRRVTVDPSGEGISPAR